MSRKSLLASATAAVVAFVVALVVGDNLPWVRERSDVSKIEVSTLRSEIAALDNPLLDALEEQFPDEYAEILATFVLKGKTGASEQAIAIYAANAIAQFRRENSEYILSVSDKTAKAILNDSIDITKLVLERRSPEICQTFANQGMVAFVNDRLSIELEAEITKSGVLMMNALAEGRDSPVERNRGTEIEWEEFRAQLRRTPEGDEALDFLMSGNMVSPAVCPSLVVFIEALVNFDEPYAHKLRAESAYGIVSN